MRWLIAPLALFVAVPAMAQAVPVDAVPGIRAKVSASYEITGAMLDSAEGWNRGDVDRFLAVYSDDPGTSFTGGHGMARGRAGIRARYLASYPEQFGGGAAAPASRLSFTMEDFRLIGSDHALLIARWKLVTGGDEAGAKTGMTSLLFRHEAGGWKIIADHSS